MSTVTVKGEGGSVFDLDVPEEGTVQRELLDDALAKGRLSVVEDPDGALASEEETEEATPASDGPPAKSANKAEWQAYARTQAQDPDEAAAIDDLTKDQLVEKYGGEG